MTYDPPIPIVERLAPGAQTRAGIAWRLYWLWPEMRCLYLVALLAWGFAAFVAPRYFEMTHYPDAGVFAPIELIAFAPLLYLGFLSGAPGGGFAPSSGRALAMLPVQGKRMRDAVWFIDVPSAPLIYIVACVLMALIIPLPAPHRLWFIVAALLTATIYCGTRATMSVSMLAYFRPRPHGLLDRLAHRVDQLAPGLVVICIVAMILGRNLPQTTWAAVAICAATGVLSFAHRPMMAGTRGDGGARREKGSAAFSSGWWEIARIYAPPMLTTCGMIALFTMFFWYLSPDGDLGFPYEVIVIMNASAGQFLATRVRAARLVPLSTRTLTIATLMHGLASAIPLPIFFWALDPESLSDTWSVVALLCATIFMAALSASSIWSTFYSFLYFVVYLAILLATVFVFYSVVFSADAPPTMQVALLALIITVPLLAAVAWSIERKFWWDSKVYRSQYQQQHRQMNLGNLSASGEALLLGFALLVMVAGILCGIVWFAAGAS